MKTLGKDVSGGEISNDQGQEVQRGVACWRTRMKTSLAGPGVQRV